MGHQVDKYTSQLQGQAQAGVPHVVQPQDHRHTGGWDLTDLSDDGVHQACWGEVIHQVEEAQGAEVSPVSQWLSLSTSGDKIIRVRQLVVDKAVSLNPLSELVSLTADHCGKTLRHQGLGNIHSTNDDGAASLLREAKLSSYSFLCLLYVVHSDLDLVTYQLLPQELSSLEHEWDVIERLETLLPVS